MKKTGITIVALLVITAIFLSGCTSPSSSPAQQSASSKTDTVFDRLLLSPEYLPQGLVRAADGPMQASDITDTMRNFGWQRGYRVLYADAIPLTDKSKVMEQAIMIFDEANASAMLEEHKKSFTDIKSTDITALLLPDPNLGEKSFAIKVTTTSTTGAETYFYVIGFVKSGKYEVFSFEGTPATYPAFLHLAERAADKIR